MRIFPEGYEQTLQPCGKAMAILGALLIGAAVIGLFWSLRFAIGAASLGGGFWLGGKALCFVATWMQRRGLKLP